MPCILFQTGLDTTLISHFVLVDSSSVDRLDTWAVFRTPHCLAPQAALNGRTTSNGVVDTHDRVAQISSDRPRWEYDRQSYSSVGIKQAIHAFSGWRNQALRYPFRNASSVWVIFHAICIQDIFEDIAAKLEQWELLLGPSAAMLLKQGLGKIKDNIFCQLFNARCMALPMS
jgi:hypothetical protein